MAVITLSRQYGSGGDEIAARVCEHLGYRHFDKSLMAQVAAEMGLSDGEIVDFSEDQHKVRGFLDRLFSPRPAVAQRRVWTEDKAGVRAVSVAALDSAQAVTLARATVEAAYRRGDVVILGRGGQVILRDRPGVLHVRVIAPLNDRVRWVQQHEGLNFERAHERVAEREQASADYLKRFHGVEVQDPTLYHLVLNTGRWDVATATHLILEAVGQLAQPEGL